MAKPFDFSTMGSTFCPLTYTVSVTPDPSLSFFTLTSGPVINIESNSLSLASFNDGASPYVSTYDLTIVGEDAGSTEIISCPLTLTVDSPCDNITITETAQGTITDNFSGITMTYNLTPFTVSPSLCAPIVTYECMSVMFMPDSGTAMNDYSSLCDNFVYPNQAGNL